MGRKGFSPQRYRLPVFSILKIPCRSGTSAPIRRSRYPPPRQRRIRERLRKDPTARAATSPEAGRRRTRPVRIVLRATELPDKDSFRRNTFHTTSSTTCLPKPRLAGRKTETAASTASSSIPRTPPIYQDADHRGSLYRRYRVSRRQGDHRLPSGLEEKRGPRRTVTLCWSRRSMDGYRLGGFYHPDPETYKSIEDFNKPLHQIGNDVSGGPQASMKSTRSPLSSPPLILCSTPTA